MNQKQITTIVIAVLLMAVLAAFPPWKYVDGTFIGFAPVYDQPEPQPDSLYTGEVAPEHVEIKIVPSTLAPSEDRNTDMNDEQKKTPVVDVRKMLTVGTIIFLAAIVAVFAFDDRTRSASEQQARAALERTTKANKLDRDE
ncbi:hypothetical protein KQI52_12125 [bacterium]|nr:hypothetical protein [bacterium]